MVIPQIKRTGDDGLIIAYLKSDQVVPNLGLVESLIRTLRMNWLAFALETTDCDREKVRRTAVWCVGQLKAQIALIESSFDIVPTPRITPTTVSTTPVVPAVAGTSFQENEDEDDTPPNADIDLGEGFDMLNNFLMQGDK
ncbi:MAG: hypothetical protein AAFX80_22515 [Cyanobacteria bacterium J06639_18]